MFNKRLLNLLPQTKKYIFFSVLLNLVSLLSNVMILFSLCSLINKVYIGTAIGSDFLFTCLIFMLGIVIRSICTKLNTKIAFQSSESVKRILRNKVYKKLCSLGVSYNSSIATSEAVQLAVEGINQLESFFTQYMPQLFYSLLAALMLFFVLSFISLKSALILLVAVPVIPVSIMLVQKIAKKLLNKYWDSYTTLGDSFLENIQGLTTLKIYQADEEKHKEMNINAENFRKATMRVLIMQLNSISIMDLVAYGGAAIGMITAVNEFSKGNIDLFGTMAIILLAADFFIPMRRLGSFFHIAMNGMSASDKIFRLLDTPDGEKGKNKLNTITKINCRNLSFSYDNNRTVLNNIALELSERSLICLVGESGCGKSTTAKILSGTLKGYSGSILLNETELNTIDDNDLMNLITYIDHKSYIFKGTLEYNLKMAKPDATKPEMLNVLKQVKLYDFFNENQGLDTLISETGENLSGGQRQRLAIARALLHDTPVYIFDEATSNIDAQSEEAILKVITELSKTKAVLMITHRLANTPCAKQIYVMQNGVIKEKGTFTELINKKSLFSTLYNSQYNLENISRKENLICAEAD